MIQCHGIGVIQLDEWVTPDPRTSIQVPSFVRMTKVINLRLARKRAARLQEEQRAAERLLVKAQGEKARREVDGHWIENGEGR